MKSIIIETDTVMNEDDRAKLAAAIKTQLAAGVLVLEKGLRFVGAIDKPNAMEVVVGPVDPLRGIRRNETYVHNG